jgi:hypothetical protein
MAGRLPFTLGTAAWKWFPALGSLLLCARGSCIAGRTVALYNRLPSTRNNVSMTIDDALASQNPVGEIFGRLAQARPSTRSEQTFWDAAYFHTDALNGGLHQAMTNSTGDVFASVKAFVDSYCDSTVARIFTGIAQLFPHGVVPANRSERNILIFEMSADENGVFDELTEENDPFAELTTDFYGVEDRFADGLIALASKNRSDFPSLD